ncbi:cysteine hydrolase family protein [Ancylobacter amanitiformis]|uniref:Nicotinamidase-related amidase n=1 Tax=Ancylobacter amanitiformis TaxID=217069 RepID=A0ABU0LSP9_9HYPH|nr:isochorismatase family cysteine hydrolase [Ancylobacter amanitiformis]MDQ0511727.1 nicotinamidase-related amidase [Ancylobacter amanitiformis]
MSDLRRSWLMVIDHQPAFTHPASAWFTPAAAHSTPKVASLVPLFGERVVFTRFVPPAVPGGSWIPYYDKWSFAHAEGSDWLWEVDEPWREQRSISSDTFSKWTADARAIFAPEDEIVMCGISTDCCVLATAFAAVDAGAHVRIVADACAAKSRDVHENALAIMASRAPQLSIVTAAEEAERRHQALLRSGET